MNECFLYLSSQPTERGGGLMGEKDGGRTKEEKKKGN